MKTYNMIGLMSGTSLDGVDLVFVRLGNNDAKEWQHEIIHGKTYPLPRPLAEQLENAGSLQASKAFQLDHELGVFFGNAINEFIGQHAIEKNAIDAIASHGQTIFHQPAKGFTTQIGNPAVIARVTGIPTIGDFRSKDVLYGGQGAPLVPIGDVYLFGGQAEAFLNIGGFANISFRKDGKISAFDICPGNLPLNRLARSKGVPYDRNGELAAAGELNYFLLDLLNSLPFYDQPAPKSLGTEWLEQSFYPLLKFDKDIENNLATVVEHIATQIARTLGDNSIGSVMITGGGAKNSFLIERLKRYYKGRIVLPDETITDFKEALIFALLGALFLRNEPNCLSSVTGASKDVCGGVLHTP
jgi:anhydro-N-acetylmuramic acid kinase